MKFSIRDVLWLTVVVALAVGWWLDHRRGKPDGWIIEFRGFTKHQAQVQIEPVDAQYHDDLPAFFKQANSAVQ